MKFIKRQILDEREEQLVNKAGMEAFSFLMTSNLTFYIGNIFFLHCLCHRSNSFYFQ